ncbi:unnamed protein product [Soboliphyme baturini]|uniref:Hexosyltransferase n=1 Tax=Soboliphyme baturini TaxID=241478 RepID=A0A183IIA1_9BILA|nr:unnamed protein product [Soboliphyme baturini]
MCFLGCTFVLVMVLTGRRLFFGLSSTKCEAAKDIEVSINHTHRVHFPLITVVQQSQRYLQKYRYKLVEKNACKNDSSDVTLLIAVLTNPSRLYNRMFIRKTWGHRRFYPHVKAKVLFMMGSRGPKEDEKIRLESNLYHDIVQEDFFDSYKNITYKVLMVMRYTLMYCQQASFVLKVDDDVFVNIFELASYIYHIRRYVKANQKTIFCDVVNQTLVNRDKFHRFYVSKEEFEPNWFPEYCSGPSYLLSVDVIWTLYNAAMHSKYFWIEDVYITGILASQTGVSLQTISSVAFGICPAAEYYNFIKHGLWCHLSFRPQILYPLWRNLLRWYNFEVSTSA